MFESTIGFIKHIRRYIEHILLDSGIVAEYMDNELGNKEDYVPHIALSPRSLHINYALVPQLGSSNVGRCRTHFEMSILYWGKDRWKLYSTYLPFVMLVNMQLKGCQKRQSVIRSNKFQRRFTMSTHWVWGNLLSIIYFGFLHYLS